MVFQNQRVAVVNVMTTDSGTRWFWTICGWVNVAIAGSILAYFVLVWEDNPFSLGGSMIYFTLITLNIFISTLRLMNPRFLTTFSMMLLSFMGLNHIAYLESLHGVQSEYAPWYVAIVIIMFFLFLVSSRSFLGFGSERTSEREIYLRKDVVEFMVIRACYPLLMAAFANGIAFVGYVNREPKPLHLSLMNHYVFWFAAGQMWLLLSKRRDLDRAFSKLVIGKSPLKIRNPRKVFIIFSIVTLCVGSIFEMMRGLWFVWFGTWAAVVLLVMNYWRMLKYTIVEEDQRDFEIRDNETFDIKGIQDNWSYYLFRFVLIGSLIVSAYMIALAVLLAKRMY